MRISVRSWTSAIVFLAAALQVFGQSPSQWTPGSALSIARSGPGGGIAPAGTIYNKLVVAGGVLGNGSPTNQSDLVDFTGHVTHAPNLQAPLKDHSSVIYCCSPWSAPFLEIEGGATNSGLSQLAQTPVEPFTFWTGTPIVDYTCQSCNGIPTGRSQHAFSGQYNNQQGTIVRSMFGGRNPDGLASWALEFVDNNSSTIFYTPEIPRVFLTATTLPDGRVLIVGGTDANGNPVAATEIYSPVGVFGATGTMDDPAGSGKQVYMGGMAAGPTLLHPRSHHVAILLPDGRVLIAGGLDASGKPMASTEIITIPAVGSSITATSVDGPPMNVARSDFQAVSLTNNNSWMLLGGLTTGNVPTAASEFFEPWNTTFRSLSQTMTDPRSGFLAGANGKTVVVAGGLGASGVLASTEVYEYPTIQSNDTAYDQPFLITGTGWPVSTTINLTITAAAPYSYSTTIPVTTQADGTFSYSFTPPANIPSFMIGGSVGAGYAEAKVGPYNVHACDGDRKNCFAFVNGDSGPGTLRDAVQFSTTGSVISLNADQAVCSPITVSFSLTIQGPATIQPCTRSDGAKAKTRLFILTGSGVTISHLTLKNAWAQGTDGTSDPGPQDSQINRESGGGGGAGLGGAVFVASSGSVTLSNITFTNNHVQGGAGGSGTTDGENSQGGGYPGGTDAALAGLLPAAFGAGGAGGSRSGGLPHNGNLGGGGGGGGFESGAVGNGGAYGGDGSGGGTHHVTAIDETDYGGGGGGGAALGGAVYIQSGNVTLNGDIFTGNITVGGAGGLTNFDYPNGNPGSGVGNALFAYTGSTVTLQNESNLGLSPCGAGPQDYCSPGSVVSKLSTTLTLTASPSGAYAESLVTLSAQLNAATSGLTIAPALEGLVDFYDGITFVGSSSFVNGAAQFQTLNLPAGTRHLSAIYAGTQFLQAASARTSVVVKAMPAAISTHVTSFSSEALPMGIVAGDFNNDQQMDLAVTSASGGALVHFGNGDGTFGGTQILAGIGTGTGAAGGIVASDFGFHGALSIAADGPDNQVGLALFLGNGLGQFTSQPISGVSQAVSTLFAADLDRDGLPDIVAVQPSSPGIEVETGQPGSFVLSTGLPSSTAANTVVVGDLNNDGIPDVVGGSAPSGGKIWVDIGNGDGSTQNPVPYNVTGTVYSIAIGDFDGNGVPDLAVADSAGLEILLGNGNGTFQSAVTTSLSSHASKLAAGDFDGDGKDDIAYTDQTTNSVYIYLSGGNGLLTLAPGGIFGIGALPTSLAVADFNLDGVPDIAVTAAQANKVFIIQGNSAFSVAITPGGAFFQGENGAVDSVVVRNSGNPFTGTVSVYLAATGVTISVPSPNGWNCTLPVCTITGTFATGNLPAIPVTFNIPATATTLTLAASVTAPNHVGATLASSISAPPGVQITASLNTGSLYSGQTNGQMAVNVKNISGANIAASTSFQLAYSFTGVTLPVQSVAGSGWTCNTVSQTCGISAAVLNNSSYPALTFTFGRVPDSTATLNAVFTPAFAGIPQSAQAVSSPLLTPNFSLSVPSAQTTVYSALPNATFLATAQNNTGATFGPSRITMTPPANLTATSGAGTGWTCSSTTICASSSSTVSANQAFLPLTLIESWNGQNAGTAYSTQFNLQLQKADSSWYTVAAQSTALQSALSPTLSIAITPITKTFTQGQQNVQFALNVMNSGPGYTAGATIVQNLPGAGLNVVSIAGFGWTCTAAGVCTNSVLTLPGQSLPTLTFTANISGNAAATVTESASVSYPGNVTGTTSLPVPVNQTNLVMRVAHSGSFTANGSAAWTITVQNAGATAAVGDFVVTDVVPSGLTVTNASGVGWNCSISPVDCERIDTLQPGYSFPAITVSVGLPANPLISLTNTATLTGSGPTFSVGDTVHLGVPVSVTLLTPSPAIQGLGQPVTFTASITPSVYNVSPLTGSVLFLDNQNVVGVGAVSNQVATLTSSALPAGVHQIEAIYSGNSAYATGISGFQQATVSASPSSGMFAFSSGNPASSEGTSMVIADFNGDGIPDVVRAYDDDEGDGYGIEYDLGQADGSFVKQQRILPQLGHFSAFAIGDFNGDGIPDVVASGGGGLVMLLNQPQLSRFIPPGGGTYNPFVTNIGGDSIVTGDFNRDGKVDVAFVSSFNGLGVAYGNGDGTFNSEQDFPYYFAVGGGDGPSVEMKVGDFNGDTLPDLLLPDPNQNVIHVLLGQKDGSFAPPVDTPTGNGPESAAIADFNGDGRQDVATANHYDGTVCLLLSNGDGTFAPPTDPTGGCYAANSAAAVTVGDFNGDGKPDVAFTMAPDDSSQIGSVSVLFGNGDGTMTPSPQVLPAEYDPLRIYAADFNRDGVTDLAVYNRHSNPSIDIYLGVSPRWSLQMTRTGPATQNQTSLQYTLTASNTGTGPSGGTVTLTELPAPGLTITAMSGPGWTCPAGGTTCTRSDALAAGSSYPAIAVTANVGAVSLVSNQASIAGGRASNVASTQDSTTTATSRVKLSLIQHYDGPAVVAIPLTGLRVTVDGASYQLPATISIPANQPVTISFNSPQLLTTDTRADFDYWNDYGNASHSVTFSADQTMTLNYSVEFLVTASVYPVGGGSVSGLGWHFPDTPFSLTAIPASGYVFSSWNGDYTGTTPNPVISINGPKSIGANFAVSAPALSVAITGKADGPSGPPQRVWTLSITNKGVGTAVGVTISAMAMSVTAGTGKPALLTGAPAGVGDIGAGQTVMFPITWNYPASPVAITQLRLVLSANNGAYSTPLITINNQTR